MLVGMMLIGTVVGLGQVGLKPTVKKLKPDFGRLNVLKGLKRTFGPQVWWEVVKSTAQDRTSLVVIVWPAVAHAVSELQVRRRTARSRDSRASAR